jgi:hypothetical protein
VKVESVGEESEENDSEGEETKAKRRGYIYNTGANNESEEEGMHTTHVQTINLHGLASVSSMKDDPGNCSPLYSS